MEKFVLRKLLYSLSTLREDFFGRKRFLEFLTNTFISHMNDDWIVMKPKDTTQEEDLIFCDVPTLIQLPIGNTMSTGKRESDLNQWIEGKRLLRTKKGVTFPF